MAAPDPLRRLGGGRWETKDGRFTIEPQSGTWVAVDSTQTNEFGLPLVRGPFPSLGAAREAIETARTEGPARSPLEDRIEEARREAPRQPASSTSTVKAKKGSKAEPAPSREGSLPPSPKPQPAPEPPPEPAWLRNLTPADRRRAKGLIARLAELGIEHGEDIVRADVAGDQPALARLALERRLGDVAKAASDPQTAVRAAIEAILDGKDDDTGARWRLVDGDGRQITTVKLDG
jgi:hypothetical protein